MATGRNTQMQVALQTERSLVVYGGDVPVARILNGLAGKQPPRPLDLRARALEGSVADLRKKVAFHLSRNPLLVLLIGTYVPDGVRTVVAEVVAGRLNLEDGKLPEATRLVAISPTDNPEAQVTDLFAVRLRAQDALLPVGGA